ncbi:MAG: hypothetical protein ABSE91_03685 [Patescibacteria group bacterium]|jgi:hypothetical protein
MKKNWPLAFIIVLIGAGLLARGLFPHAFAAGVPTTTNSGVPTTTNSTVSTTTDLGSVTTIGDYVNAIMKWAVPVISTLAIIMLIIAGYIYMTSQGNPDSIKNAKDIIIGVVLGLALLWLASLLFKTLGANVIP